MVPVWGAHFFLKAGITFGSFLVKVSFILFLLSEMGYGLDLKKCTVSGSTKDLFYVSPRSGKAVSKLVGNKYHQKLFKLPNFFINTSKKVDKKIIKNGLKINNYFKF